MQIEYKGFVARQCDNDPHHVMIFKDGVYLTCASVDRIMDEKGLRSIIDDMISADEAIRKMRTDHAAKIKHGKKDGDGNGT